MTSWRVTATIAVFVLFTCAPAFAQRRASISRPSAEGPSSRVGLIGGSFTRGGVTPPTGQRAVQTGGFAGFGGFGQLGAANRPNDGAGSWFLGQPTIPGLYRPNALRGVWTRGPGRMGLFNASNRTNSGELLTVTFYRRLLQNDMPLMGVAPPIVEVRDRYYIADDTKRSDFQEFFDLKPAAPAPVSAVAADTVFEHRWERINEISRMQRDRLRNKAIELFRAATQKEVADRGMLLADAGARIQTLASMEPDNQTLQLLAAMIEIDRSQYVIAAAQLLESVQRLPSVFVNAPDMKQFYGDPERLNATLRRSRRLDTNADVDPVVAWTVESFTSWISGDLRRTRELLDRIDQTDVKPEFEARTNSYVRALRAALAQGS